MTKYRQLIVSALASIALAAPCFGDKLTVVPATEASKESFQVNKRLGWYTNLDEAKQEAGKSGRLVFWVHMLGSMDGKT